jgi:serine protease Do
MVVLGLFVVISLAEAQERQKPPRASLGITVEPTPRETNATGVVVRDVDPDGPAAKAGLRSGDVIVKFGDKEIKDYDSLVNTLITHQTGDKVHLQIRRDGKEQGLEVTLGQRPARPGGLGGRARTKPGGFLGIHTQPLTPELKKQFGTNAEEGVLVTEVVPDTPAAKAGLLRGDVITSVDDKRISTPEELREAIRTAEAGTEVTLKVVRGETKKEVKARLDAAPVEFALPVPGNRLPLEGLPPFGEAQKIQQLERRIEQLEAKVRELEKKQNQPGSETRK